MAAMLCSGTGSNGSPITLSFREVVTAVPYGNAETDVTFVNGKYERIRLTYDAFVEGWKKALGQ